MDEHFDDNGFKDPTPNLTGAVWKLICEKVDANSVKLKARKDLSSVNSKLVSADVYNNLPRKKIQVRIVVRNNADHGSFGEYAADDVADMVGGVERFHADRLQ